LFMNLNEIQNRYNDQVLAEAALRFGFNHSELTELEGSSFVYEGLADESPRILKITPGYWNTTVQVTGSTVEQVLAEVDFVRYLADHGMQVAAPVPSRQRNWVEIIPLDNQACFLATCVEKVPGFMYPDEDEVQFPQAVLEEWGRTCGQLHRLSAGFQPNQDRRRLSWRDNDLLDFSVLIPTEQTLIYQRRDEIMRALEALPQGAESYGLIHGDFHHGNFFVDGGKVIVFDFDAAEYSWYIGEIVTALENCLPLPRAQVEKRRLFALNFLSHFLTGYRSERPLESFWVQQVPLFLKYNELLRYAYFQKFWDMTQLSERRAAVLNDLRRRLEEQIPVVEFQPGDLEVL